MKISKFNWQMWAGFLLSIVAFLSYPFFFVRFPVTRDFPWANLLLFGIAGLLLFGGVRRAWRVQKPDSEGKFKPVRRSRVAAAILTTFGVLILGLFVFSTFVMSRWLPSAQGAPQVGQKAPDFALVDTDGSLVQLSELLSAPINSKAALVKPRGVLLVFYRGYW